MPFILCATICCCLPCIISVLGFREDLNQTRGATSESINALPTYKFKLKKSRNSDGVGESGVVAAGTEKERAISGEDAVSALWPSLSGHTAVLIFSRCYFFCLAAVLDEKLKTET